jgi:DNA-binding response OmpR family regulator
MARASLSDPPAGELYMIPGEVPDTRDIEDARQWVTIYRELVSFAERTLKRLRSGGVTIPLASDRSDADERSMESHLRRLQSRLDFWERRIWELGGLDLDISRRVLSYGGHTVLLTRREAELLGFLALRPGQYFSPAELVSLAWGSQELSAEQLRTYVVRLRRLLSRAKVRARLISEPRRGYGLIFTA